MLYILLTLVVGASAIFYGLFTILSRVPDLPDMDYNKWWGSEPRGENDESIRPFKIEFNQTVVDDLKARLRNRRPFTKPLEGIKSEYGINTEYLEGVMNYWAEKYDFQDRANRLNRHSHFKTRIQGLDIHFIRAVPEAKDVKVLPLLLLHGWPSSSKEFDKIIPVLTTKRSGYDFVFEVVAADLPGFGFSEGTNKPGLSPAQIGIILRNLMRRLGYKKFYIQGGDWGSQTATQMVTMFPDEILGFHTNMPISSRPISNIKVLLGSLFPSLAVDAKYVKRLYPLKNTLGQLIKETGYFHLQATKPDTIGTALTDTPTGLAAYIMEKAGVISNKDQINTIHGGLENLELDDVLDTITIMWVNNCVVTSIRIYREAFTSAESKVLQKIPTKVPTAAINFLHEMFYQPDWILRDKFPNLVHSTAHEFGGHFAALQTPKELVDDVFAAAAEFLKFHDRRGQ